MFRFCGAPYPSTVEPPALGCLRCRSEVVVQWHPPGRLRDCSTSCARLPLPYHSAMRILSGTRRTTFAVVVLATVALLAPACSSDDAATPDQSAEAAPMTTEQARDWYASLGCQNFAGWTAYSTALADQDSTEPGSPVDASMVVGATTYRDALNAFTTQLTNPPAPWPSEVGDDIEVLVRYNTTVMVPYLETVISSGSTWPEPVPNGETERSRDASTEIRRLLGAPPFGVDC